MHPVLDHNYIVGSSVVGGELALRFQPHQPDARRERHPPPAGSVQPYFAGVAGTFTRATSRAQLEAAADRARAAS